MGEFLWLASALSLRVCLEVVSLWIKMGHLAPSRGETAYIFLLLRMEFSFWLLLIFILFYFQILDKKVPFARPSPHHQ
jgi:hypothetical protein